jgi:hypothetical protein
MSAGEKLFFGFRETDGRRVRFLGTGRDARLGGGATVNTER